MPIKRLAALAFMCQILLFLAMTMGCAPYKVDLLSHNVMKDRIDEENAATPFVEDPYFGVVVWEEGVCREIEKVSVSRYKKLFYLFQVSKNQYNASLVTDAQICNEKIKQDTYQIDVGDKHVLLKKLEDKSLIKGLENSEDYHTTFYIDVADVPEEVVNYYKSEKKQIYYTSRGKKEKFQRVGNLLSQEYKARQLTGNFNECLAGNLEPCRTFMKKVRSSDDRKKQAEEQIITLASEYFVPAIAKARSDNQLHSLYEELSSWGVPYKQRKIWQDELKEKARRRHASEYRNYKGVSIKVDQYLASAQSNLNKMGVLRGYSLSACYEGRGVVRYKLDMTTVGALSGLFVASSEGLDKAANYYGQNKRKVEAYFRQVPGVRTVKEGYCGKKPWYY